MSNKGPGKPPKHPYKDSYPDEMLDMMTIGKLDVHIATKWKISRNTFYKWLREKPDLQEAHDQGLMACEAFYIDKGLLGIDGAIKGFSFNAWIAIMNNKFKWAKNALTDPSNITNNTINIGNMQINGQLPRQDLIDKIKLLGNKSKDILDVEYIELNEQDKSG